MKNKHRQTQTRLLVLRRGGGPVHGVCVWLLCQRAFKPCLPSIWAAIMIHILPYLSHSQHYNLPRLTLITLHGTHDYDSVCVWKTRFDFQSICWVRTWQGGTGGILFVPTHTHTLMKPTDADLVRGQAPGLSALVSHTHTHTQRWGAHLLGACQRLPSLPVGVYVCCGCSRGGSRWEYWWIML